MNSSQLFDTAQRLSASGQAFAMVSVLRVQAPTSARPGDKALVLADGTLHGWVGGGCALPAVLKTARAALADGLPRTIRIAPAESSAERELNEVLEFGMACHSGGTLELFIDPVLPQTRLTVFGDSPLARALVALAPRVGFDVQLVAEGALAEDYADARRVLASDEAQAVKAALGGSDYAVVATQGRRDLQALKAALALQPRCLWFVASARKAEVLKASLLAAGEDAQAVADIVAPAGQSIGARTPEEIALSVLGAVVARKRLPLMDDKPAASVAPSSATAAAAAPAAASSCCGGAKLAAPVVEAVPVPAAGPAVNSCCGGS